MSDPVAASGLSVFMCPHCRYLHFVTFDNHNEIICQGLLTGPQVDNLVQQLVALRPMVRDTVEGAGMQ